MSPPPIHHGALGCKEGSLYPSIAFAVPPVFEGHRAKRWSMSTVRSAPRPRPCAYAHSCGWEHSRNAFHKVGCCSTAHLTRRLAR